MLERFWKGVQKDFLESPGDSLEPRRSVRKFLWSDFEIVQERLAFSIPKETRKTGSAQEACLEADATPAGEHVERLRKGHIFVSELFWKGRGTQ